VFLSRCKVIISYEQQQQQQRMLLAWQQHQEDSVNVLNDMCVMRRLRDGVYNVLSISSLGNQYIQANKPWDLLKGSDDDR